MVMAAPTASNKVLLPLAEIRLDGGTQSRALLDDATIERYAENYGAEMAMPAVVVFYDGTSYWLADGFHRCAGATKFGRDAIIAEIFQGSVRDAILYSVGANEKHGLPRSNADKRRAVEMLLRDEEWGKKSDSWIAKACAVSHTFVAKLRQPETLQVERLGQDGKVRKLPTRKSTEDLNSPALNAEAPAAFGPPDPAQWWACPDCESEFNLESATGQGWVTRGACDTCASVAAMSNDDCDLGPASTIDVSGVELVAQGSAVPVGNGWPTAEERFARIERRMTKCRPLAERLQHELNGIVADVRAIGIEHIGGLGGFRVGIELTALRQTLNELKGIFP